MNSNISLKKNFVLNIFLTLSTIIFPLLTFPYVSRVIGPLGTGKVTFATSVISYFSLFAQLGIPTYGIRICSKYRDDKDKLNQTFQELLIINLLMDVLTYIVFFVLVNTISKFIEYKTLLILMSSTILLTSIGLEWLYRALEQYSFITYTSVIFKVIAMILMLVTIHNKTDYYAYGVLTVVAASGSFLLNFIYASKLVSFKPIGNYNFKQHIRPIAIFFAMSCATTIYTNLDNVMLGFMVGDVEVGYYNAAVKVKMALISVVTSLGTVLLPRISYFIARDKHDNAIAIIKNAIQFVFFSAIPLTVYFILYAKESIYFLSGNQYNPSIIPMQIIMPTVLIVGLSNVTGIQILIPLGKERVVLHSEIAGAIADLIVNLILINTFKSSGAAIGTLIAEIIVLGIQYHEIKNEYGNIFVTKNINTLFFSTIISSFLSLIIKLLNLGVFLTLLLSAIIFFITYFVLMYLFENLIALEVVNTIKKSLDNISNKNLM